MKRLLWSVIALFLAVPVSAQIQGDQVPRGRTVPVRDAVKAEIEDARFHLGPIRMSPTFHLNNAGYNDNIFGVGDGEEKVSDYSATVGAGLNAIMPLGSKVFIRADAIPEYTWYLEHSELNRSGHELQGSLLGLFNHLSLEATGSSVDTVTPLSVEDQRPTQQRRGRAFAGLELDLLERLSLFGGAESQKSSFEDLAAPVQGNLPASSLDRTENAYRGGIRYKLASWFDVSAEVEKTFSEFDGSAANNDLQSTAYLLGIRYDRPKFFLNLAGGTRKVESYNGSDAPSVSGGSGSIYAAYSIRRSTIDFSASRRITFSVFLDNPYFTESSVGAGLNIPLGSRLSVRMYGNTGNNNYPRPVLVGNEIVKRSDDMDEIGGGIGIRLFRTATLNLLTSRVRLSSNIEQFSRSSTRMTVGISFQGDM